MELAGAQHAAVRKQLNEADSHARGAWQEGPDLDSSKGAPEAAASLYNLLHSLAWVAALLTSSSRGHSAGSPASILLLHMPQPYCSMVLITIGVQ